MHHSTMTNLSCVIQMNIQILGGKSSSEPILLNPIIKSWQWNRVEEIRVPWMVKRELEWLREALRSSSYECIARPLQVTLINCGKAISNKSTFRFWKSSNYISSFKKEEWVMWSSITLKSWRSGLRIRSEAKNCSSSFISQSLIIGSVYLLFMAP